MAYDELLKYDFKYEDLYKMDLKELVRSIEQRREGLAYKLWKEAILIGLASNNGKSYPKNYKEACPELFPPKKRIKMPKWMKERMLKKGGVEYE